jgi:hypothetical protein
MLIDESDLSVARGAPVQHHPHHPRIAQPKHAGNSLCVGECFSSSAPYSVFKMQCPCVTKLLERISSSYGTNRNLQTTTKDLLLSNVEIFSPKTC